MNRFRKEEISAAKVCAEIPATPFSWSVSRHLLFHRCRRAYFLHYYFAQGGWDPYADPLLRFVWSAKKSRSYPEQLERHLEEILRFSFDTLRNVPPAFRVRMLSNRFQMRLTALEDRWRTEEPSGIFDYKTALADLKDALSSFLTSGTCSAIASAQNLTLFNKAFKPSFFFREIELWYNPGLIWRESGHLVSLRLHFSKPDPAFIRAESDMFAFSARNHTGERETLSLFRYRASGVWKEIQCRGDAESAEKRILSDTETMKSLIFDDHISIMDFPAESGAVCDSCRFSAVCAAIAEEFGEL